MKRLSVISSAILIAVFLFAPTASAWDDAGHKISAYIAWSKMTPEAKLRTAQILQRSPEDSHLGVYFLAGSRSRAAKELDQFMIASTWPDIIRNQSFAVRYAKYNQGPWHYAGVFWNQNGSKGEKLEQVGDGVAPAKLYDFEKALADPAVSDADKAIHLAWFLHVAGDIHQPLHNGSRMTETDKEGDRGGNLFLLSAPEAENRVNLHGYWDGIFSRSSPRVNDKCDSDYIIPMATEFMNKHSHESYEKRFDLGNYNGWHAEGFNFLASNVYTGELNRGTLPSEKYRAASFELSRERIVKAGYRIAETLNKVLGKEVKPAVVSNGR